ncbi:MAG: Crp/Fnr family transcriptional regulator [Gammaproteobacteria bacterium]
MTRLAPEELLRGNALFAALPDESFAQVVSLAHVRSFPKGQSIFMQGDPGDALYGVVSGKVLISASGADGKEISLNLQEPGTLFGEIALLDGQPRTANATTAAKSELVVIQRNHFHELLKREPTLTIQLLELVCERIRWTSSMAEDSALLPVPARLAKRLLTMSRLSGKAHAHGVELRISQAELANFLGVSRQIVNQYLQQWKRSGAVELGRGRIVVTDADELEDVSEGFDE